MTVLNMQESVVFFILATTLENKIYEMIPLTRVIKNIPTIYG